MRRMRHCECFQSISRIYGFPIEWHGRSSANNHSSQDSEEYKDNENNSSNVSSSKRQASTLLHTIDVSQLDGLPPQTNAPPRRRVHQYQSSFLLLSQNLRSGPRRPNRSWRPNPSPKNPTPNDGSRNPNLNLW
jgi:hypothetical protein